MCNFSIGVIELDKMFLQQPSPLFVKAVNVLLDPNPQYLDSIANWNNFFQGTSSSPGWGTGQPTRILLGGTGASLYGLDVSTFSEQGQVWMEEQGAASVGWFVASGGGSVSGGG